MSYSARSGSLGQIRRRAFLPISAVALIVVGVSLMALSQKVTSAKVTEDLPPDPTQSKATTACLECHEARIIVQQRLSKAAWSKEVDKMIKWGAVVDAKDRTALIDYLSANFSPDHPPYAPPRTSTEKTPSKSGREKLR